MARKHLMPMQKTLGPFPTRSEHPVSLLLSSVLVQEQTLLNWTIWLVEPENHSEPPVSTSCCKETSLIKSKELPARPHPLFQDLQAIPDHQDWMDLLEPWVEWDHQEMQDSQDQLDDEDLQDHQGQWEHLDEPVQVL